MKHIAIFASGSGSNAEAITRYFHSHSYIRVALIISNRAKAGVLGRMQKLNVPTAFWGADRWKNSEWVIGELDKYHIDLIALAGFLKKLPAPLVQAFKGPVLNIHPALLPRHGGKGMYGKHVHTAVLEAGDKETGITVHQVNERYDKGRVVFQKTIPVPEGCTAEGIQKLVQKLEHKYYPQVIESVIKNAEL